MKFKKLLFVVLAATCLICVMVHSENSIKKEAAKKVDSNEMKEVKELLSDVLWSFQKSSYSSQAEFLQALKKYNEDVLKKPFKYPVATPIPSIGKTMKILLFDEFSEEYQSKEANEFIITADNGQNLSGLEILYKLNNHLYPLLKNSDFCYFEGISICKASDGSVYYKLNLGS